MCIRDSAGSVVMLVIVVLTAASLGAWSIPLGVTAQSLIAAWIYRREITALYRTGDSPDFVDPTPGQLRRRGTGGDSPTGDEKGRDEAPGDTERRRLDKAELTALSDPSSSPTRVS